MKNPLLIPQPFANNGNKNTINNTRVTGQEPESATWADGFPAVTMTPKEAGGLPPKGLDFNGIFFALSDNTVFQEKGGRYHFDASFANSIGGYSKGAVLLADDDSKEYISLKDANKINFNTATAAQIKSNWAVLSISAIDEQLNKKANQADLAVVEQTANNAYNTSNANTTKIGQVESRINTADVGRKSSVLIIDDFYNVPEITQRYTVAASNIENGPTGAAFTGTIDVIKRFHGAGDELIIWAHAGGKSFKIIRSSGTWGGWVEVLDSSYISDLTSGTNKTKLASEYALGEVNKIAAEANATAATKADKTITLAAGNGLTGGGTLAANRTLTLGTPSSITASSTNSVATTSHTHAIDSATTARAGIVQLNDSLTSTATNQALTAAQGQLINARLDAADVGTKTSVLTIDDFHSVPSITQRYTIAASTIKNSPVGAGFTGVIDVIKRYYDGGDELIIIAYTGGKTFKIVRTGGAWGAWVELLDSSYLSDLTTGSSKVKAATEFALGEVNKAAADANATAATKADKTVTLTAGNGLTGGGTLAASRSFGIDKASLSQLSAGTANKVVTADILQQAFAKSTSAKGYTKLPNGLILQWGTRPHRADNSGAEDVTFPITFPNACLNIALTASLSGQIDGNALPILISMTATSFMWVPDASHNTARGCGLHWSAIGY